MKWYSSKKFKPGQTGDQIIFRVLGGYIHAGVWDHLKDKGYVFEAHNGDIFPLHETTHFCIPDPIEIEE